MHQKTPAHHHNRLLFSWILLIGLLAVTAWCTRYWLSAEFGLYEDDLTFIPGAIEGDFNAVVQMISGYFSTLAQQGRPLMWSWVVLFAHLGWRSGGLQGMYVIAYMIWLVNITLFVLLLRRVHGGFLFCALGGFAYVLFSADTNQAFLFNAFGLQTAITFLLIAFHIYLANNRSHWFAYFFLVLIMLNYETPFFLFLAAPLLTKAKGKILKNKLLVNTLLMAIIFFAIYFLRLSSGESRVASLNFPDIFITPLKHMAIGPFVGLGAYFLRPFQVIRNLTPALGLVVGAGSAVVLVMLLWAKGRHQPSVTDFLPFRKVWWASMDPAPRRELRLALAGIIMLVFAYPLTLILRPYAISGRETRVHLAAVLGAALIMASMIMLIIRALKGKTPRVVMLVFVSLIFGLNFAFGFLIQEDYRRSWDLQKSFWRELLPLIPDVEEGTAVMIEPSGLIDVLYIDANTWNLPRILPQFFVFPENWASPPQAFRLVSNWQNHILRQDGSFTLDEITSPGPPSAYGNYLQKKAIFIATASGELERRSEPLPLEEQMISLKPAGEDILSGLETRPLYDLMIRED